MRLPRPRSLSRQPLPQHSLLRHQPLPRRSSRESQSPRAAPPCRQYLYYCWVLDFFPADLYYFVANFLTTSLSSTTVGTGPTHWSHLYYKFITPVCPIFLRQRNIYPKTMLTVPKIFLLIPQQQPKSLRHPSLLQHQKNTRK